MNFHTKVIVSRLSSLEHEVIPNQGEDSRPVPKQVQCLENNTDLFKMFEATKRARAALKASEIDEDRWKITEKRSKTMAKGSIS